MQHRLILATAAAVISMPLALSPALAAGGEPPTPTPTTQNCKKGQVWDKKKKECVKAQSGLFDDDTLYEAARELAYFGRHEEALDLLDMAADPNDPRILNYKGFANRKAGRVNVAMGYYRRALERDPGYSLARSYYGEALIETGDIAGARAQLAEIRRVDGPVNYAYFALAQALRSGKSY